MKAHIALCLSACGVALGMGPGASEPARFEVSEDGHARVRVALSPSDETGWVERGWGVPFGTSPDWTLNLRRQVGSVRIADMNGDELNDLVVGCYISQSFPPYEDWHDMIFYNTGSGLPPGPSWISSDQIHTGDTQVGDINGDDLPDVFAVSGGGSFSPPRIYFGQIGGPSTSPGWLSTPPTAGWATSATLWDIDNDDDLDVITTNQGVSPNPYRPMYFFRNNAGSLETSPSWQSAESGIQNTTAAADYDDDGFADIAVAKWAAFESAIYRNVSGTLETAPTWTNGTTDTDRGVAWGDIDGNGWPDLVIGENPSLVYENDMGTLTPAYTVVPPFNSPQEITLRDIDGDDDLDFAEVHFGDGRTHIYLNTGGMLSGTPSWTFDATEVGNAIDFGDLNGDGRPDLVVGYSGNISVRVFYQLPPMCLADFTGEGTVNTDDFIAYLGAYSGGDAQADLAHSANLTCGEGGDGTINTDDFICYLSLYAAGCP